MRIFLSGVPLAKTFALRVIVSMGRGTDRDKAAYSATDTGFVQACADNYEAFGNRE